MSRMKRQSRKIISLLLLVAMLCTNVSGSLMVPAFADTDCVTVELSIANETFPEKDGAEWSDTLYEGQITVPAGSTMMDAIVAAAEEEGFAVDGAAGGYIYAIDGLYSFDGGSESGWMGTLNDWFVNKSFSDFVIKNGDVIAVRYTCNNGDDLGCSWSRNDKSLKAVEVEGALLAPTFQSNLYHYNLVVPGNGTEVKFFTTATNKNFQVKTIDAKGIEYERGQALTVSPGDVVQIVCGRISWPTVNNAMEVPERVYTLTVHDDDELFQVDTEGTLCTVKTNRLNREYSIGERVKLTIEHGPLYRVKEDGVKVYNASNGAEVGIAELLEDNIYTFEMPAHDVIVKAECVGREDVQFTAKGEMKNGTLTFDHEDGAYYPGEEVVFTLTPDEGMRINEDQIRITGEDSKSSIAFEYREPGKYAFVMPAENVAIRAEAEEITQAALTGYTLETNGAVRQIGFTEGSRVSREELGKGMTNFHVRFTPAEGVRIIDVRYTSLGGNTIKLRTDDNYRCENVSVGAINQAKLGGEIILQVTTKDALNKEQVYTIRLRTEADEALVNDCLIQLKKANGTVLSRTDDAENGIPVYSSIYPTEVKDSRAQTAEVYLYIYPYYEQEGTPLKITTPGRAFSKVSAPKEEISEYYKSSKITVRAGRTVNIPLTITYGDGTVKKYKYVISNTGYTVHKVRLLSKGGQPLSAYGALLDGIRLPDEVMEYDEEGYATLELTPGQYRFSAKGYEAVLNSEKHELTTVPEIKTDVQTDIETYQVTFDGMTDDQVITVKNGDTGELYAQKTSKKSMYLPKGRYEYKLQGNGYYSRATFYVKNKNLKLKVSRPDLKDPEIIAQQLNQLESIQTTVFDNKVYIYQPDYKDVFIEIKTELSEEGDHIQFNYDGTIPIDRNEKNNLMRYSVVNTRDPEGGTFYTEYMELHVPSNGKGPLPDVRELKLIFSHENGETVGGSFSCNEANHRIDSGEYRVCYTMVYYGDEDGEPQNVCYTNRPNNAGGYPYLVELSTTKEGSIFVSDSFGDTFYAGSYQNHKQGKYEITAWFEDDGGNRSKSATITLYKDNIAPRAPRVSVNTETGIYETMMETEEGSVKIDPPENPEYAGQKVIFTIESADDEKTASGKVPYFTGLADEPYSFDGGKTWTSSPSFAVSESTTISLSDFKVRDKMGNKSSPESFGFGDGKFVTNNKYVFVDLKDPVIQNVMSKYEGGKVQLTVSAEDTDSGIAEKGYSFDGGKTWQKSPKFTWDLREGTYDTANILVQDGAGNQTRNKSYLWDINNLDTEPPVIEEVKIIYDGEGATDERGNLWHKAATVEIVAEDKGSGIYRYSFDGETYVGDSLVRYDEPTYLTGIRVIDQAGNVASYGSPVDLRHLDSEGPHISVVEQAYGSGNTLDDIKVVIDASDNGIGDMEYMIEPHNSDSVSGKLIQTTPLWQESNELSVRENILNRYGTTQLWQELYSGVQLKRASMYVGFGVRDALGNTTLERVNSFSGNYEKVYCEIGKIDFYPPQISDVVVEYKYFNDKSGQVRVYVAAKDSLEGAGLAARAYSFDGGKTWQKDNYTTVAWGTVIKAGQIQVRDRYYNTVTWDHNVRTKLQEVIGLIATLKSDPDKKELDEIQKKYDKLTEEEKEKVYNWDTYLEALARYSDDEFMEREDKPGNDNKDDGTNQDGEKPSGGNSGNDGQQKPKPDSGEKPDGGSKQESQSPEGSQQGGQNGDGSQQMPESGQQNGSGQQAPEQGPGTSVPSGGMTPGGSSSGIEESVPESETDGSVEDSGQGEIPNPTPDNKTDETAVEDDGKNKSDEEKTKKNGVVLSDKPEPLPDWSTPESGMQEQKVTNYQEITLQERLKQGGSIVQGLKTITIVLLFITAIGACSYGFIRTYRRYRKEC